MPYHSRTSVRTAPCWYGLSWDANELFRRSSRGAMNSSAAGASVASSESAESAAMPLCRKAGSSQHRGFPERDLSSQQACTRICATAGRRGPAPCPGPPPVGTGALRKPPHSQSGPSTPTPVGEHQEFRPLEVSVVGVLCGGVGGTAHSPSDHLALLPPPLLCSLPTRCTTNRLWGGVRYCVTRPAAARG